MQIFQSDSPLAWGKIHTPLLGLSKDWYGQPVNPPSLFSLVQDPENLWFISVFDQNSKIHPDALPGKFTPELWKYDVAELFMANPRSGQYLEFNLTSNASWWASKFDSARLASPIQPDFHSVIKAYHGPSGDGQTVAALKIPLIFLKKEIDFDVQIVANITTIRNTPTQQFLSATPLPGAEPDFHQPEHFTRFAQSPLPND